MLFEKNPRNLSGKTDNRRTYTGQHYVPIWWEQKTLHLRTLASEIFIANWLNTGYLMGYIRIELTYQLSNLSFSRNFIVLVVFLVIVQSSELISVWFCEKMTFFSNFFSYHIFAIYVGGASLGLPTACRLIAVSGAGLPLANGLVVRCIKMHHHVKSAITIYLQFISNMFTIYKCIPTHRGSAPVFMPTKSSVIRDLYKVD